MLKILVHSSFIDFTHVEGAPDITQINVIVFAIITRFWFCIEKARYKFLIIIIIIIIIITSD